MLIHYNLWALKRWARRLHACIHVFRLRLPKFSGLHGHNLVQWREKATPYNSQPSRVQNNRHVYKSAVTSRIHSRHVYKTTFTPTIHIITSTKQPSRLQFTAVTPTKQPSRLQFTTCFVDVTGVNSRRYG